MTDAPKHIWPIDEPHVPYWLEFEPKTTTHCLGQYTRTDLAEQAERDAYARGVADARKVKPLEWDDGDFYCEARTFGLVFAVTYISDNWWYRCDCCGSLVEAKYAAQDDYNARILSTLTDPMQETHNAKT